MVRLVAMDEAAFRPYVERLIRTYAADHVRAGTWTAEEAEVKARGEVEHLLPHGTKTPGHFLYTIAAGAPEVRVGIAWLAIESRGAFVYDLEVEPEHRRHGYAEAAMRALEPIAREHGADRISLHVFGDNLGARRLYERLGYAETNVRMAKSLGTGGP